MPSPFLIFHLSNLDFELNLLVRYEHGGGGERREGKKGRARGKKVGEKGEGRVNRLTLAESNGGLLVKHVTIDLHFYLPTSLS